MTKKGEKMKRQITNYEDVVFITRVVPLDNLKRSNSFKGIQKIFDFCVNKSDEELSSALIMAFNYGYALGKHDERKKA
jgi:hypothetical protein